MECILLIVIISVVIFFVLRQRSSSKKKTSRGVIQSDSSPNVEYSLNYMPDGWINLENDLWLSHSKSEVGNFILAWKQGAYNEMGEYLLSHQNTTLCSGTMIRPDHGQVSNNGTFVLMDCTGGLTSTFHAFNKDRTKIMECGFRALPFSIGISSNGSYAVAQMCNAPSKSDSSVLVFFDLTNRKECWRKSLETGWSDSYRFNDELGELIVLDDKFGAFRYSYENGIFLDLDKWEHRLITRGDGGDILRVCEERFMRCSDEISDVDVQDLQNLVSHAHEKQDIQNDDRAIARMYRLSGEIYEAGGYCKEAISKYKNALSIDEKVGVKMKLKRLQKKLYE